MTKPRLSLKLLWKLLDDYKEEKSNASQWSIPTFLEFVEQQMKSTPKVN